MAADMTLYVLPQAKYSIDREISLKWKVMEMEYFGDALEGYDDDEDPREIIINAIDTYWFLDCRRDVSNLLLEGKWYFATGGLSWGDPPTDATSIFEYLDELWQMLDKFADEDRSAHYKSLEEE